MSKTQLKKSLSAVDLQPEQRQEKLRAVHEFMLLNADTIDGPNFKRISNSDLGLLFHVTDEQFFSGAVSSACESHASRPLSFRISRRMTTSGGMTTMTSDRKSREFEIAIASTPLFQSFRNDHAIRVGGLICDDRLEALQRIMEHEMIHLAEMIVWDDSNCSQRRFRSIAHSVFGHTESNHQLLTPKDIARKQFRIRPGDAVEFSAHGRAKTGFVNRITKRATVLVADPSGTLYTDGLKYVKFYVPIERLSKTRPAA